MTGFSQVHWSSKSYNWDSPMDLYLDLNEEFHFNLDPTNRPIANLPGLVDGLRQKWLFSKEFLKKPSEGKRWPYSRVFLNPPYKRGLILDYVQKAIMEMKLGRVSLVVFLIPLRNSDYFKTLRKAGAEFRLCNKRLKFGDADNSSELKKDKTMTCPHCSKEILLRKASESNTSNSAPFDSVVAILSIDT